MELKKEDIKNYVGYRFIVEPVKKLTVKEHVSSIHGMSGYSGFAGISGFPIYQLSTVELHKYTDTEIIECSKDSEWIRIAENNNYATSKTYGHWVKTDNFIEAYTIIAAFEPVEK